VLSFCAAFTLAFVVTMACLDSRMIHERLLQDEAERMNRNTNRMNAVSNDALGLPDQRYEIKYRE